MALRTFGRLHGPEYAGRLWTMYVEQEMTIAEIARHFRSKKSATRNALLWHEIPLRSNSEAKIVAARTRGCKQLLGSTGAGEWLRARYIDDEWSIAELARELGFTYTGVRNMLEYHGIERREANAPRHRRNYPLPRHMKWTKARAAQARRADAAAQAEARAAGLNRARIHASPEG